MKSVVICYSRTGTTRKVAAALAPMLGADIVEVRCSRYGPGPISYLRAAIDSVRGRLPTVSLSAPIEGYDLIVLCAPVWTSHPATPMRSTLAERKPIRGRTGLLLTHLGSPAAEAFEMLRGDLATAPVAELALRSKDISEGRVRGQLEKFAQRLAAAAGREANLT